MALLNLMGGAKMRGGWGGDVALKVELKRYDPTFLLEFVLETFCRLLF